MKTLLDALRRWIEACEYGADPIEALSGHMCGPNCWHWPAMGEERRRKLLRAPWNQGLSSD